MMANNIVSLDQASEDINLRSIIYLLDSAYGFTRANIRKTLFVCL